MQPARLRELAVVLDQPCPPPGRPVPILQWSIHPETGRPVSRWILSADRPG
jgi:hypothetical protein